MAEKNQSIQAVQRVATQLLEIIQRVCNNLKIISLNRQIEVCSNIVNRDALIDVAILGQFKAGKSSFLNSIVGRGLLPVGVIPVTTVITRIRHGERERAEVSHFDGSVKEISLNDLAEYTSEAKNPANQKDVALVDIELPTLKDYPGLRFVDTPGLGSVYRYQIETSKNWLPAVGAAILAISADRPLSEHDIALVRELIHFTPQIILLLTKVDLLEPQQQVEVISFFEETLQRELHRKFPIFLYSNRTGMEKFRTQLNEDFLYRLSTNLDTEFSGILQHKIDSLTKNCLDYLEIALKTSQEADSDREALKKQILGEKGNLTSIQEELIVLTRAQTIHTRTNIERHLERFKKPLAHKLMDILKQELPLWKGNLWNLSRHYEEWLQENLTGELDEISIHENKQFLGTLIKAHAALERYLESFRALMGSNIERILGIKMIPAAWNLDVTQPSRPDIRIGQVFQFHFDLLWFLIPMFLFRNLFERHFLKEIPYQVHINMSRLVTQWEDRINRAIEEMRKQTARYIREEIATIEALLSQSSGQSEDIRRMIDELESSALGRSEIPYKPG
jgi:GTP-binding protein EngB required for normal cell division